MNMIEKVARALSIADGMHPDAVSNDECETPIWELYSDDARAAIEAMRSPTPSMLKAACASMSPEKRPTEKFVSVKAKHGIRYRAMIDAALEETK